MDKYASLIARRTHAMDIYLYKFTHVPSQFSDVHTGTAVNLWWVLSGHHCYSHNHDTSLKNHAAQHTRIVINAARIRQCAAETLPKNVE